jgi:hypothetical protein
MTVAQMDRNGSCTWHGANLTSRGVVGSKEAQVGHAMWWLCRLCNWGAINHVLFCCMVARSPDASGLLSPAQLTPTPPSLCRTQVSTHIEVYVLPKIAWLSKGNAIGRQQRLEEQHKAAGPLLSGYQPRHRLPQPLPASKKESLSEPAFYLPSFLLFSIVG